MESQAMGIAFVRFIDIFQLACFDVGQLKKGVAKIGGKFEKISWCVLLMVSRYDGGTKYCPMKFIIYSVLWYSWTMV